MPIPAPEPYRRSNLTAEQKQEQLAAVYGVTMPPTLTAQEIETMRQILKEHDAERKPIQVIDLNNPPKEQYRFQKFPMMVYDLEHSKPGHVVSRIVHSEEELETALEKGWSEEAPAYRDERVEPLSAALQAEANRVQAQLDAANEKEHRKPGRPRKDAVA